MSLTAAMMTGVGVILGTAAYMSPEQARGKPVPTLRAGKPASLFEAPYTYGYLDWSLNDDVGPDGRFLMVRGVLHAIVNWFDELTRLVPVN